MDAVSLKNASNGICDNGLYCDGAETCRPVNEHLVELLIERADSRRQNHPHHITIPLGDGGEKKFNWASELSVPLDNLSSTAIRPCFTES